MYLICRLSLWVCAIGSANSGFTGSPTQLLRRPQLLTPRALRPLYRSICVYSHIEKIFSTLEDNGSPTSFKETSIFKIEELPEEFRVSTIIRYGIKRTKAVCGYHEHLNRLLLPYLGRTRPAKIHSRSDIIRLTPIPGWPENYSHLQIFVRLDNLTI